MGDKRVSGETPGNAKREEILEKKNPAEGGQKPKRKIKLSTVFWSVFIGLALLFAAIEVAYNLLEEKASKTFQKLEGNKTLTQKGERLKEEIFRFLEQNNRLALRRAWEKSLPQIEELKRKNLSEVKNYIDRKLDFYFKVHIFWNNGIDLFLDWLYSTKTQYYLTLLKGKELAERGINSVATRLANKTLFNATPEVARYIEEHFYRFVLNPEDLQGYINREIVPYMEKKFTEFQKEVFKIVETRYREELRNLTSERFGNSTEVQKLVSLYLQTHKGDMEKFLLHKVSVITTLKVGEGIGLTLITYKVLTKISAKVSEKIAVKVGEKVGSKLISAASGFAEGLALCAWAGPFDLVCAVGGAVITTIATDYAINKIDEHLTREKMKKHLLENLKKLQTSLGKLLYETYRGKVEAFENHLSEEFYKGIPLRELAK